MSERTRQLRKQYRETVLAFRRLVSTFELVAKSVEDDGDKALAYNEIHRAKVSLGDATE